ncbi:MAG: type III-B CRISPR-associated protein Cas10/Cmr2 [Anaerolineae bacterium]|nr:MAG: type III-B CRISPR-associated protein Cas10/Cmr2 [Anaerolineae bacterium]
MSQERLFLCQIGPVQSFIAAARRTQDLYVGSRLLSILASAGVEAVRHYVGDSSLIFPVVLDNGKLPKSVPHRFSFISDQQPTELAQQIEDAIRERWQNIAEQVGQWLYDQIGGGGWEDIFMKQVTAWLEFYWVAVDYDSNAHGEAYQRAVGAMAARKQGRTFTQVYEPGIKCTITGAQSALPLDWKRLKKAIHDNQDIILRDSEQLGALATIKRFAGKRFAAVPGIDETSFPDTTTIAGGTREDDEENDRPLYLAVLHMDGDRMGKWLSDMQTTEEHREFSRQLAEFAEITVPHIIQEQVKKPPKNQRGTGALVYAGGDDVLALLPLWAALRCSDAIRRAFEDQIDGTMSAGIAITPHKLPLDGALEEARTAAEKRAKKHYGRNAICIRQNTGQIREAGANWDIAQLMLDIQFCFEEDYLSGKLGYDLLTVSHELAIESTVPSLAISHEALRLLKRRTKEGLDGDIKNKIADLARDFDRLGNSEIVGWQSLANWVILARFLAKGAKA